MDSQELKQSAQHLQKVALVHDFLTVYGGAERVFGAIAEIFPEAPIYTLLADSRITERYFFGHSIRTSWIGRLPHFLRQRYRWFLPFFPVAVESFDLRDFDIVISSSGAWSKGIITRLNTRHIAYVHSPMRYVWDYHEQYLMELGGHSGKMNLLTRALLSYLRIWDRQAAERPDVLLVNSHFTQQRVNKYYRRDSVLLYPGALSLAEQTPPLPSDIAPLPREHFLLVSRLTRSKKIMPVIEAFNKLGLQLVIVGSGPERRALEKIAGKHIRFVGFVEDAMLVMLYRQARAVIFPSEEDFGMVAVEALSFGSPVVAYEYGGIREIVHPGITGELFRAQTSEIIAEGIRRFLVREGQYDMVVMRQSVASFTKKRFQDGLKRFLETQSSGF
ncbi:MAG: glycosyltransferase [Minisyncoccota bacterium]